MSRLYSSIVKLTKKLDHSTTSKSFLELVHSFYTGKNWNYRIRPTWSMFKITAVEHSLFPKNFGHNTNHRVVAYFLMHNILLYYVYRPHRRTLAGDREANTRRVEVSHSPILQNEKIFDFLTLFFSSKKTFSSFYGMIENFFLVGSYQAKNILVRPKCFKQSPSTIGNFYDEFIIMCPYRIFYMSSVMNLFQLCQ